MIRRRTFAGFFLAGVAVAGLLFARPVAPVQAAPGLTDAEFAAVRTVVKPQPDEDQFAQIPWLTSIWEAREQAAKEGKPILLWEMDGHPLGCG